MSPAVKMAEIQQVKLPVVLRVVDGVDILEQSERERGTKTGWSGMWDSYINTILVWVFFFFLRPPLSLLKAESF